jgi:hypothetical protein
MILPASAGSRSPATWAIASFVLPQDVLNALSWRVVTPDEVDVVRHMEADAVTAARQRARRAH